MIALRALGKAEIITPRDRLTPSQEILFATGLYLFLERAKPLSRMTMAETLWPGANDAARQHRLRQTIFQLKNAGFPLETSRETVLLPAETRESDLDVLFVHGAGDIAAIESLQFLPGYAPTFSAEFAHWLDAKRNEVSSATSRLLINDIRRARSRGDWLRVERLAFRCMEVDPFNEEAVLARAEASAMRGAKREAVTILDQFVADLGVAASEIKLPANLMRKRISERVPEAAFNARAERIFVGRETDMSLLTALLDDARAGKGRCCLLWGDAGIGKSRLASELGKFGELQGVQVRRVACRRGDAQRPLSVFVEAVPQLREMRGALGCSPDTMADLQRLTQFDIGSSAKSAMELDPQSIFELIRLAIFDLIDAVSEEQPLMLVIEDVHWLDAASARILGQLADWSVKKRLLLLFTSRMRENPLLEACTRAGLITHHIRPISNEAASALVREMFDATNEEGDAEFVSWCQQVGDGNPFFIHELVKQWLETKQRHAIPPSITAVIRERFTRLSAEGTQLLQACSILGENSTLPRVEKMLQQEPYMLLGALNELSKTSMLSAERKPIVGSKDFKLAPKHDLISMVAFEELDPHAAAFLHRRAGEILEAELGENTQDTALLWACAQHWQKAGDSARAYQLATQCGELLFQVGLPSEAASAFERARKYAVTDAESESVLHREIEALERAQAWNRLVVVLKDHPCGGHATDTHDDHELRYLYASWRISIDSAEVFAHLLNCVNHAHAPSNHRAKAGVIAIKIASNNGDWGKVDGIYSSLCTILDDLPVNDPTRLEMEMIYHTMRGDVRRASELSEAFVLSVRETSNLNKICRALENVSDIHNLAGNWNTAESAIREAIRTAADHRCFRLATLMSSGFARSLMARGEVSRAQEELQRFAGLADVEEDPIAAERHRTLKAQIHIAEGRLAEASALCEVLRQKVLLLPKPRRGLILATLVRLNTAMRATSDEFYSELQMLLQHHFDYRSAGWQDYETMSLYLGLVADGRIDEGRELIADYVNRYRRDRSELPPDIVRVLHRE